MIETILASQPIQLLSKEDVSINNKSSTKPRVALANITNVANSPVRKTIISKKFAVKPVASPKPKPVNRSTETSVLSTPTAAPESLALSAPVPALNRPSIITYDLEFLKSFRTLPQCTRLPTGQSPQQVIDEYNAEYEKKEASDLAKSINELSLGTAEGKRPQTPQKTPKKKVWRVKGKDHPVLSKFVPVEPSVEQAAFVEPKKVVIVKKEEALRAEKVTGEENYEEDEEGEGKEPIDLARRLASRMKQISYGKNTDGYANYMSLIPKEKRKRTDPSTPDAQQNCSKRSFDGQVRKWRRALHQYDEAEANSALRRKLF